MKLPKWAKYVARDKRGSLWVYSEEPSKDSSVAWVNTSGMYEMIDYKLFPDVKWTDDDPTEIHHKKEESIETHDPVNHPPHYQRGGIETIDIIKMSLTEEEYLGYLKGNVIKYRERAGLKGKEEEDLKKAKWYYDELSKQDHDVMTQRYYANLD